MEIHGIIGGGLSGTLCAIRLLYYAQAPITIHIFEKDNKKMFKGEAYSSSLSHQLLNVTADHMSIFEDQPSHFADWLYNNGYKYLPEDFVPRSIYGEYLTECLNEINLQSPQHIFYTHSKEITDIQFSKNMFKVMAENHHPLHCDNIWLCTGNLPPSPLPVFSKIQHSPNYISNPWSGKDLLNFEKNEQIVIIGSGLTMVDQVLSLYKNGHKGKITVISRKGLLPLPYKICTSISLQEIPDFKKLGLLQLLKWIRKEVVHAEKKGYDWRSVIKSLREYTPVIWQSLSAEDKDLFIRRLATFWNIHRHQIPTESYRQLKTLELSGQLSISSGKIVNVKETLEGFQLDVIEKDLKTQRQFKAEKIINCTGPANYKNVGSPLFQNLLRKKFIVTDKLGLGIQLNPSPPYSFHLRNFHIIGPPAKGKFWECTALREIRKQTHQLIKSESYA